MQNKLKAVARLEERLLAMGDVVARTGRRILSLSIPGIDLLPPLRLLEPKPTEPQQHQQLVPAAGSPTSRKRGSKGKARKHSKTAATVPSSNNTEVADTTLNQLLLINKALAARVVALEQRQEEKERRFTTEVHSHAASIWPCRPRFPPHTQHTHMTPHNTDGGTGEAHEGSHGRRDGAPLPNLS